MARAAVISSSSLWRLRSSGVRLTKTSGILFNVGMYYGILTTAYVLTNCYWLKINVFENTFSSRAQTQISGIFNLLYLSIFPFFSEPLIGNTISVINDLENNFTKNIFILCTCLCDFTRKKIV